MAILKPRKMVFILEQVPSAKAIARYAICMQKIKDKYYELITHIQDQLSDLWSQFLKKFIFTHSRQMIVR